MGDSQSGAGGDAYVINPNLGIWNGISWVYKLGVSADQNPGAPIEVKVSRQGIRYMLDGGNNGMQTLVYYGWHEIFWKEEMLLPLNLKEFKEK